MKIYETLDSGIKIVEYQPSLAATIADMWNQSREDWGGGSSIMTASQVIAKHETASNYNVYIAMDGEEAVGYCSFARYHNDNDTAYIPLLGVRTDYKSKKIGKALVLKCVQRTIELGYPRLDLYTWAGNTAAVPLYKKCGFLWEDRPDYTHLVNFIPTILTESLFADFFKNADWYSDSKRPLDIKPDGIKENGFETFGYAWEKGGQTLRIDYERTGRQIRLIETNDYKIELFAQDHELAFGVNYNCRFVIENKTGKELNVKINGKEDKNIRFDYTLDTQATDKQEYPATFFVGETDEVQDLWKTHPCLLAEVEINNGHKINFGLGIETKFPLKAEIVQETVVSHIEAKVKTHIALHSGLLEDAKVNFALPNNTLLSVEENSFALDIKAKGKASVSTNAVTTGIGFELINIPCEVELQDGTKLKTTAKAHLVHQDMTHAFGGESLTHHQIFNGPWKLQLEKESNEAYIGHLTNPDFSHGGFEPPKFGKPYDDEFNLIKPNITKYQSGTNMVMEAEFVSEKFPGMVVTQIYTLGAGGFITRVNKIENRGNKPQHVMLRDCYDLALGCDTIFSYKGEITQNHEPHVAEGIVDGLDNISSDELTENWVFNASTTAPKGFAWPKEYKPTIQWGYNTAFEIDPGELNPGEIFETKPVIYAYGSFSNFSDFRNFALQTFSTAEIVPTHAVDIRLNGYNPFISGDSFDVKILNNRDDVRAGNITVSGETQTNPDDEPVEENLFTVPASSGNIVEINFDMAKYKKTAYKAVFPISGKIECVKSGTNICVSNGLITFKSDPAYGQVCYSLTDKNGREWLQHQYPHHKEFAWWNPFMGGIRAIPYHLNNLAVLKEKITAELTTDTDSLGNTWQGICTTIDITQDEEFRGMKVKSYFLTMPGVPVLCAFYRLENNTGEYKRKVVEFDAFFAVDDVENTYIEAIDKNGRSYNTRLGDETGNIPFENVLAYDSNSDNGILYFVDNSRNTKNESYAEGDGKFPLVAGCNIESPVADKAVFTAAPMFFVISDDKLPQGALDDLARIRFK